MTGRNDDGNAVITRVLDGPDPGVPWRSRLRAQRALLLVTGGRRWDESVEQAQLAIAEGERDGDPVTVGLALHTLMQAASGTDALEIVDRGLRVVVGADPESMDLRLLFLTNRLVALSNLHRLAEFEAALTSTIALAESQGLLAWLGSSVIAALTLWTTATGTGLCCIWTRHLIR